MKSSHDFFAEHPKWELFIKHFIAGGVAGVVSRTFTAPLDRLKIFYQISRQRPNMAKVFADMYKEGGILGLWRGNLMNILKTGPKSAIRFAVYDHSKILIKKRDPKRELDTMDRFLAGSLAGLVSQIIIYPMDMVKVRLTLRTTGQYKGIIDAIVSIYRAEGIRSFGRGFVPTIVSSVPYSGLDLAGYETMKRLLKSNSGKDPSSLELLVIGSVSCMIAQVATYPLALVCTRLQAEETDLRTYKPSTRRMFKEILKKEGIAGLYRGLIPHLLKFIPVVGLTFVTYEAVNDMLGIHMA